MPVWLRIAKLCVSSFNIWLDHFVKKAGSVSKMPWYIDTISSQNGIAKRMNIHKKDGLSSYVLLGSTKCVIKISQTQRIQMKVVSKEISIVFLWPFGKIRNHHCHEKWVANDRYAFFTERTCSIKIFPADFPEGADVHLKCNALEAKSLIHQTTSHYFV